MRNKKSFMVVGAVLLIAAIWLLVSGTDRPTPKKSETITVATTRAISTAILAVADNQHYFEKEGLAVKLVPLQTGDETLKALLSGSADVALAAVTPYAFLALEHPEIKLFATIADSNDNQILARKGKGIAKPQDLKGMKVGFIKTTVSEIGLEKFLEANGLHHDDIQWINLKPLALPAALASGEIDAYSAWEPHLANGARLVGNNATLFEEPENTYSWQMNLFANESYLIQHHGTLVQFLRAISSAETYVRDHKESAIAITAMHTTIPADNLSLIWKKFDFKVKLGGSIVKVIQENLEWANSRREQKMGDLPDSKSLINATFFNQIQ